MAILNGIIKKMTGSAGQQRQRMKWVNIIRQGQGRVERGSFTLTLSQNRA